ncbi:MAG: AI-2E family transporter, partial [Limisphaerales bacterium]
MTRILVVLFVVVLFAYSARMVVLPILVAWIGSMMLKPPVGWLHAHRFPNYLASLIIVGIFLVIVCCGIYYLSRPAAEWIKSAPETLPRLRQKYESVFRHVSRLSHAASSLTQLSSNSNTNKNASRNSPPPTRAPEMANGSMLGKLFTWTGSMAAGVGETVVLLFLFLASGDTFMHKLVHLMPTLSDKKRAVEITHEIQHGVSRYLFTVTLINLGLGTLIGTALHFLGMPNAALWGAVATLLNFIPYFGPVIGMILVALAGLVSMDSVAKGLAPAGAYLCVHI